MKKFLVFVLLLTIFGLTGCSHIEDTNGEDDYIIRFKENQGRKSEDGGN